MNPLSDEQERLRLERLRFPPGKKVDPKKIKWVRTITFSVVFLAAMAWSLTIVLKNSSQGRSDLEWDENGAMLRGAAVADRLRNVKTINPHKSTDRWFDMDLCYGKKGQVDVKYRTSVGDTEDTYLENLASESKGGSVQKIVFDALNHPLGQTKYVAFASRAYYLWADTDILYAFSLGMIQPKQAIIYVNITNWECVNTPRGVTSYADAVYSIVDTFLPNADMMVDGLLYTITMDDQVTALDAETGKYESINFHNFQYPKVGVYWFCSILNISLVGLMVMYIGYAGYVGVIKKEFAKAYPKWEKDYIHRDYTASKGFECVSVHVDGQVWENSNPFQIGVVKKKKSLCRPQTHVELLVQFPDRNEPVWLLRGQVSPVMKVGDRVEMSSPDTILNPEGEFMKINKDGTVKVGVGEAADYEIHNYPSLSQVFLLPKIPRQASNPFFIIDVLFGDPIINKASYEKAINSATAQGIMLCVPIILLPMFTHLLEKPWLDDLALSLTSVYVFAGWLGMVAYFWKVRWTTMRLLCGFFDMASGAACLVSLAIVCNSFIWTLAMIAVDPTAISYVTFLIAIALYTKYSFTKMLSLQADLLTHLGKINKEKLMKNLNPEALMKGAAKAAGLKKLLIGKLRPVLEPLLHKVELLWDNIVHDLEKMSFDRLKGALQDPAAFVASLQSGIIMKDRIHDGAAALKKNLSTVKGGSDHAQALLKKLGLTFVDIIILVGGGILLICLVFIWVVLAFKLMSGASGGGVGDMISAVITPLMAAGKAVSQSGDKFEKMKKATNAKFTKKLSIASLEKKLKKVMPAGVSNAIDNAQANLQENGPAVKAVKITGPAVKAVKVASKTGAKKNTPAAKATVASTQLEGESASLQALKQAMLKLAEEYYANEVAAKNGQGNTTKKAV
jgi:hypothetical protein